MIITINCDEISDNIEKAVDFFLENKLSYIELRSINKKNLLDYSLNEIKEIKNQLAKKRLKVIAIASPLFKWFYHKPLSRIKFDNFFFNPLLSKNQKKEYIKKAFIIAELLETNFIRIFSNLSDGTIPPNIFWHDELLFYALEKAKSYGKYLLLENEPICIISKKKDIKKTFKKINNPYFKFWMDIANFYQIGDSILEKDIRDLKEVIKYVHIKDFIKKPFKYVPLGEGDINYKRIITDIRNNLKEENVILSIETHVDRNKIQATLKSLNKLRSYFSQKRIKYGIIGLGRISHKHALAINKNDNSELRGVFDINNLIKSKFAYKYDTATYKSFNDLLNDKNIDIVNICTPHNTHLKIAKKIVLSNKKVLCEKPFVLSSKDLSIALRDKKIRNNVFVVFQNNFNKPVKLLYKLVNNRNLGKINYFAINLRWWRDRKYYSGWRGNKLQSGGALFNQAIHSLIILNRVLKLKPVKITTYTQKIHKNLNIEDLIISLIKFKDGTIGNIEVFLHSTFKNIEHSIFISGKKGSIKIGGVALDQLIHLNTKENIDINEYSFETPVTHPYGNGHNKLIKVLSDYLLGINNAESNLLVRVPELKKVVHFIELLYSNVC